MSGAAGKNASDRSKRMTGVLTAQKNTDRGGSGKADDADAPRDELRPPIGSDGNAGQQRATNGSGDGSEARRERVGCGEQPGIRRVGDQS